MHASLVTLPKLLIQSPLSGIKGTLHTGQKEGLILLKYVKTLQFQYSIS